MFHGDQRTITLVSQRQDVYTYDVLDGRWLHQGRTNSPDHVKLGADWTDGKTLWFAMISGSSKNSAIDIYELQPTPSLHVHSSFPLTQNMEPPINIIDFELFSFSPVSSHASFIIEGGVIVLDIQDSKLLLQTELDTERCQLPGQFSPDGRFFISGPFQNDIHIWQNTPTGYVPWNSIGLQVQAYEYQWSPTSMSILCWCEGVIQLLHPGNCPSPPLPYKARNQNQNDYLVAYSTDKTCIATLQKFDSVVTVLNCISGTSWQFSNTEMEIEDIKIVDNTIFVVDDHKLIGWALEADGTVHGTPSARRVTVDQTLKIDSGWSLRLSHDCSQIASIKWPDILLYDIKTQKTIYGHKGLHQISIENFWFSPNGCKLLFVGFDKECYVVELGAEQDQILLQLGNGYSEDEWIMFNCSSHGYHIRGGSSWVTDSGARKILWLPPNWRTKDQQSVRWDSDFLALLNGRHPGPIIIKFHT